jgi:CRISPR-associated endonuclease/helicase Cas3
MEVNIMTAYAHTKAGCLPDQWQPLEEHLRNVADLASEFAKPFGGEEWARLAGLWHDLGKYSDAFQKKLFDANGIETHLETLPGKVIHSEAGGHNAQLMGWCGIDRVLLPHVFSYPERLHLFGLRFVEGADYVTSWWI